MNDDDFLTTAEAAIRFLQCMPAADYWIGRLPSPTDAQISDICVLYMEATLMQRQVFCSALDRRACGRLDDYAARMAMLSVRQRSETLLLHGLVALIMELDWPGLPDVREILMTLSIVYHSADKLGCADSLFQQAAQYADKPSSRDIVLGYLRRNPEAKRIEAMGWHEIAGPSGLIYRFGEQPIPEGFL
jgi:hypothetical protein